MINFIIENGIVLKEETFETFSSKTFIGNEFYLGVERVDNNTVADVSYKFDLELGEYAEQSRTTRTEPLPPEPESDADRINQLEQQLAQTNTDLAAVLEMILT
ncbi:hypothetical protein HQN89_10865 [Paenibacillus frigoriresistens]|uniref:hypothetical protein n=1 Tax=Paenibacillus alginolyticus TaxID=59839 RepID=UPI00156689B8|nr:hypothetical protein [Paenibacillus frigoriresistens]NRF91520.1 hypothetical protein [Paenibacillus frigoriresistens]